MKEFIESTQGEFEDPLSNFEPSQFDSELKRVLSEEMVSAMTSRPFLVIAPNVSIGRAIEIMSKEKTAGLLIMEGEELLGIFTERDVLERVAEQYDKLASLPVRDVMTAAPTVVYMTDPAATAVAAIAVAGHRHIPVLTVDGEVAGVLGPKRVFEYLDAFIDQ